jgi:hypothetical protein
MQEYVFCICNKYMNNYKHEKTMRAKMHHKSMSLCVPHCFGYHPQGVALLNFHNLRMLQGLNPLNLHNLRILGGGSPVKERERPIAPGRSRPFKGTRTPYSTVPVPVPVPVLVPVPSV